jgi:hypothetical protein
MTDCLHVSGKNNCYFIVNAISIIFSCRLVTDTCIHLYAILISGVFSETSPHRKSILIQPLASAGYEYGIIIDLVRAILTLSHVPTSYSTKHARWQLAYAVVCLQVFATHGGK